jgi:hypothetical protein
MNFDDVLCTSSQEKETPHAINGAGFTHNLTGEATMTLQYPLEISRKNLSMEEQAGVISGLKAAKWCVII